MYLVSLNPLDENLGVCMDINKHTLDEMRIHESLNQTQSPFYWILSLCTGVGQMFKNKSTLQFQEYFKNE